MKDTLSLIADLQKVISAKASIEEAEKWWSTVLFIETNLTFYSKATPEEKQLVQQLKRGVSAAIADIRKGYPSPYLSGAQVALTALQSHVERNTTGPDGWAIKR